MKHKLILAMAVTGWLPMAAWASDIYLKPVSGDFNTGGNWDTGTVPGAADNAYFTNSLSYTLSWSANATNANVNFTDPVGGNSASLLIGANTWFVTNRFLLDTVGALQNIAYFYSGNLVVTNAAGTGELLVGPNRGQFYFAGGTAIADRLTVTNGANSIVTMNLGTLTTLNGSTIIPTAGGGVTISTSGNPFTWNILGGLNTIVASGGTILGQSGSTGKGLVTVSGPSTVWTNTGEVFVGNFGIGSVLTVTNLGTAYSSAVKVGSGSTGLSNAIVVTGSGSLLKTAAGTEYIIGGNGSYNAMTIADGGKVEVGSGSFVAIGNGAASAFNSATITGSGSLWDVTGSVINLGSAGSSNNLTVANGGVAKADHLYFGGAATSKGNSLNVTGSSAQFQTPGNISFGVAGSPNNQATVSSGGLVTVGGITYVGTDMSSSNTLTVSGGVWSNTGALHAGYQGSYNTMILTNGGKAYASEGRVGGNSLSTGNVAIVTGSGSLWQVGGDLVVGRVDSLNNLLSIANSGVVKSATGYISHNSNTTNNTIRVTGAGSLWTNSGIAYFGVTGGGATLAIEDGGNVYANELRVGHFAASRQNSVLISGGSSTLTVGASGLFVGSSGAENTLTITNGGKLVTTASTDLGSGTSSSNNIVVVTGNGSLWDAGANPIAVGSSGAKNTLHIRDGGMVRASSIFTGFATTSTNNAVLVESGGTLEANVLQTGGYGSPQSSATFTNRGGVYQFTLATPPINAYNGAIVVTNGTISFRGVATAPTAPIPNLTYLGENNTLRLNNSSNATGTASYTFNSGLGASNYQTLVLTNNARWRSGSLTIGNDGGITGNAGDTVSLTTNFTISQNNPGFFNLSASTVEFTGGGSHTNLITGDDFGHNGLIGKDGFTANFAYGTLRLGSSSDFLYVGGDGSASNALYALRLDLPGNATNLVANLRTLTPNVNIYYGASAISPGNAYLNDQVYALSGGGFLLPAIPEPSSLLLALGAVALLLRRAWDKS